MARAFGTSHNLRRFSDLDASQRLLRFAGVVFCPAVGSSHRRADVVFLVPPGKYFFLAMWLISLSSCAVLNAEISVLSLVTEAKRVLSAGLGTDELDLFVPEGTEEQLERSAAGGHARSAVMLLMLPERITGGSDVINLPGHAVAFVANGVPWTMSAQLRRYRGYEGGDEDANVHQIGCFSLHPSMQGRLWPRLDLDSKMALFDRHWSSIQTNITSFGNPDDLRIAICGVGGPNCAIEATSGVLTIRCHPNDVEAILELSGRVVVDAGTGTPKLLGMF